MVECLGTVTFICGDSKGNHFDEAKEIIIITIFSTLDACLSGDGEKDGLKGVSM